MASVPSPPLYCFVSRLTLRVSLQLGPKKFFTTTFVDSGAAGDFITTYAAQLGIYWEALPQPVIVTAVYGRPSPRALSPTKPPFSLTVDHHTEDLHFLITISPHHLSFWDTPGLCSMTH